MDNTPAYEECIDYFLEQNVPFEHQEAMRLKWGTLEQDMDTIYKQDVSMETKLWILEEAGCNFRKRKKKSTSPRK